jgi:hypothetical protein
MEENFNLKDHYILGISFTIKSKNDIEENILKKKSNNENKIIEIII